MSCSKQRECNSSSKYAISGGSGENDVTQFQDRHYLSSDSQASANSAGARSSETKLYNETEKTEEDKTTSTEYTRLNKSLSKDDISDDLAIEYGEPLTSQHVRIDFTPLEGVDHSEYLLKKCMDFWKLVEGSKTLQHLKATPEKQVVKSVQSTDTGSSKSSLLHEGFPSSKQVAVEVMEEKGKTINDCLATKMKQQYCEDGGGDYFTDLPPSKSGIMTKWTTPHKGGRPKLPTRAQRKELSKMCQELEQWDLNHPKSMEPPNHGPPLTYAVMQRN